MNAIGFRLMEIPEVIDIHILSGEFPLTDLTALDAVVSSDDRAKKDGRRAYRVNDRIE